MAYNRLVGVDEALNLPPEVQAQLSSNLENTFNRQVSQAVADAQDYTDAQIGLIPPPPVSSVAGKVGEVVLTKGDVGLEEVDLDLLLKSRTDVDSVSFAVLDANGLLSDIAIDSTTGAFLPHTVERLRARLGLVPYSFIPDKWLFWRKYAGRRLGPVKILCLGSSTVEGAGQGAGAHQGLRWIDRLGRSLTDGDILYGVRFWPAIQQGNSVPDPVYTGSVAQETGAWEGPAGRAVTLGANGTVTFSVTGKRWRAYYVPISGGGTPTWAVDGGSPTAFGAAWAGAGGIGKTGWTQFTNYGQHTITIASAGTNVKLAGIEVSQYETDDEERGVQVYDLARSASDVNAYVMNLGTQSAWVNEFAPDLVIVGMAGSNSYAGQNRTPEQIASDIETLLGEFDRPSFVVAQYDTGRAGPNPGMKWQTYLDEQRKVANGTPNTAFISLGEFMPGIPEAPELFTDTVHPNKQGHQLIADTIGSFLMSKMVFKQVDAFTNPDDFTPPLPVNPPVPDALAMWDATTLLGVVADGAGVDSWSPQSGTYPAVGNADPATRPVLDVDGGPAGGPAVVFNATNLTRLAAPTLETAIPYPVTVAVRVKANSLPPATTQYALSGRTVSGESRFTGLGFRATPNQLFAQTASGIAGVEPNVSSGEWTVIVGRFYPDRVVVNVPGDTATTSITLGVRDEHPGLTVGHGTVTGNGALDGAIDRFAVWDTTLSDGEVATLLSEWAEDI